MYKSELSEYGRILPIIEFRWKRLSYLTQRQEQTIFMCVALMEFMYVFKRLEE